MDESEQYGRIQELFQRALNVEPDQRAAFLDRECNDDDLRRTVSGMLRADQEDSELNFRLPDGDRFRDLLEQWERPPTQVGPYEIVRTIGSGGMGIVFEAIQPHPHRRVALKMLRPVAVNADTLRRFEAEVGLLGQLQHPGIAGVFDAGVADTPVGRRPYLVLELIEGVPLDEYVRENGCSRAEILRLSIRIGEAVQHAHLRGVLHRDLKPANILVDRSGRPRILDFGLARAVHSADWQEQTSTGQVVGTLPYLAPEQFELRDSRQLDLRSDVYSLGVVLYELLAGRRPLEFHDCSPAEVMERIRTVEPLPLGRIQRRYRGDLEAVVAKALEKDRTRRYASAGEMVADLERLLAHHPVRARPPSPWYHARRFVRRNATMVGLATVVLLALLAIAAVSVNGERKARDGEREARLALGRSLFQTNLTGAERELWSLHLHSGNDDERTLWALRELYATRPLRATWTLHPSMTTVAFDPASTSVVGVREGGLLMRWDLDGRVIEQRSLPIEQWIRGGVRFAGPDVLVLDPADEARLYRVHLKSSEVRVIELGEPLSLQSCTATAMLLSQPEPDREGWRRLVWRQHTDDGDEIDLAARFASIQAASLAADGRVALAHGSDLYVGHANEELRQVPVSIPGRIRGIEWPEPRSLRVATWDPQSLVMRAFEVDAEHETCRELGSLVGNLSRGHFDRSGRFAFVVLSDREATWWELESRRRLAALSDGGHAFPPPSADGQWIVLADTSHRARLWHVARPCGGWEGEVRRAPYLGETVGRSPGEARALAWDQEGARLFGAFATEEGGSVLDVRDLKHGDRRPWIETEAPITALAAVPEDGGVLVGDHSGQCSWVRGRRTVGVAAVGSPIRSLELRGEDAYFLDERGQLHVVRAWARSVGGAESAEPVEVPRRPADSGSSLATGAGAVDFALDPDSADALVLHRDPPRASLWRPATAKSVAPEVQLPLPVSPRCAVALGNGRFAIGGDDSVIRILRANDGNLQLERELFGHHGPVFSLSLHPHQPWLASGDSAGRVLLWNHERGTDLAELLPAADLPWPAAILELSFRPGGRHLAIGGQEQRVLLLDLQGADRNVAGQLEHQIQRAAERGEDLDDDRVETLRLWAERVRESSDS